jgi:c-di-GMP-binding flagellar brake protein YcgR
MQSQITGSSHDNWHDFEVESRREIVMLLRSISAKNQLVSMRIQGKSDVSVTSVLAVDADNGVVILDRSANPSQNRDIVAADGVAFETSLDKIRIMFSSERVQACEFEGGPALRIALPATLIRLQRREFYRIATPVGTPVHAIIVLPEELGGGSEIFPLADISCGGIAILDNQLLLGECIGRKYAQCRIELPDAGIVSTALQVRNAQDMTLLNNKAKRRLGCQFIDISRPMLAIVQRYITKLEREHNARNAGLA